MVSEKLHIVFSPSAAGSLRQTLAKAGRRDRVICTFDSVSFGPIDTDDAEARAAWIERELSIADWRSVVEGDASVILESRSSARQLVAWVMLNCAESRASLLWWLSHLDDRPVSIISAPRLHSYGPDELAELLDNETLLDDRIRQKHLDHWQILQRENASFRVIESGQLVSAPIDYFDRGLMSHVTREWRKMALVVGRTLADFMDADVYQTGDLVLGARLAILAEAGILEWQGDLYTMRGCELRLPARH